MSAILTGGNMYKEVAERLLQSIESCTCSFTTVEYASKKLENAGFRKLELNHIMDWSVSKGDKIYINVYGSSLFAFCIGEDFNENSGVRLAAAHTDSPALYIKPNPEMVSKTYGKVNVEIYGGPILNTWLDRPLSVAGKVALKGNNVFEPKIRIVDFKKNLFTIPNLAIHMNREVNKGVELNRQTDMAPFCSILENELNKEDFFMEYMASQLNVPKEDILDYELYIYNRDKGCAMGISEEIISSPRLDNITSVEALVSQIVKAKRDNGINGIILFDNEEIGSRSKQGADSELLSMVLEKIYMSLGYGRDIFLSGMINGFMISADVAHAIHPNRGEKSDVTNTTLLNGGVAIKRSASQAYGTDCQSISIIEQLCQEINIPYQKFSNRSDGTVGSTLGTIANKYLPMRTVDIGVPVLAMHSARETMGAKDQYYMEQVINGFFSYV